jgi:hypothetical protein
MGSGGSPVDSDGIASCIGVTNSGGVAGCGGVARSGNGGIVVGTEGSEGDSRDSGIGSVSICWDSSDDEEEQQVGEGRRLVSPSPSLSSSNSHRIVSLVGSGPSDGGVISGGISGWRCGGVELVVR